MIVEGVMQTPDGLWRVEAVRQGGRYWYRVIHGDDVYEPLSIAAVERVLAEGGVARSTLVSADPQG